MELPNERLLLLILFSRSLYPCNLRKFRKDLYDPPDTYLGDIFYLTVPIPQWHALDQTLNIITQLHASTKNNSIIFSSRKDTIDEWQRSQEMQKGERSYKISNTQQDKRTQTILPSPSYTLLSMGRRIWASWK